MRRIATVALVAALAVGSAHAQSYHACLTYNNLYYDLTSDASITTLDRYNGAALVDRQQYAAFHRPVAGSVVWDEGVAFAATMQTRNAWLNSEQTSAATFTVNGADTAWMWYTTVNGVPNQFEFTSAKCRPAPTPAPAPNCLAWGGSSGATCTANEDCCGADTMFPQCIPKNSGKKCCTHFKGAATCEGVQSCCGAYGPGASSSAFCCNAGSTCCHASSSTQGATCCAAGTTCCAAASIGVCCAADEVCVPNMNSCAKVTTTAPTPVPNGGHRGCTSHNGWFYDLRSDASGAVLYRYNGGSFVDAQTFASLNPPVGGSMVWNQGVELASTMQTRNAWLNTAPTTGATWFQAPGTGYDQFTFSTTVNGAPAQFIFVTEACSGAPVPPTAAPTPTSPPATPPPTSAGESHRGCTSRNGWFYDLRSNNAGATLDRYNGATFIDRQNFAAFNPPVAGSIVWDQGVAFAAAMQTRNAWLNTEPTSAATWFQAPGTGNDRFIFSTTVGGAPVQFTFVTEACP